MDLPQRKMAANSPATPATKVMSSRLLTMKFMQRAAATSPSVGSGSPIANTSDEPSPKRQKTSKKQDTPTKFSVDALADNRAIQAALEEEENKRQVALEKQAAELGDTRWVLSFDGQKGGASPPKCLQVVQASFAHLDAPSSLQHQTIAGEHEDKVVMVGRRSFGRFNKVIEKQQKPDQENDSDSSDSSEEEESEASEDSDDDLGAKALIRSSKQEATNSLREERQEKKRAEKSKSAKMAKDRRKSVVSLNEKPEANLHGLTSLSGRQETAPVKCHQCHGPHFIRDCPKRPDFKRRFQGNRDDGPPRKVHKSR